MMIIEIDGLLIIFVKNMPHDWVDKRRGDLMVARLKQMGFDDEQIEKILEV